MKESTRCLGCNVAGEVSFCLLSLASKITDASPRVPNVCVDAVHRSGQALKLVVVELAPFVLAGFSLTLTIFRLTSASR